VFDRTRKDSVVVIDAPETPKKTTGAEIPTSNGDEVEATDDAEEEIPEAPDPEPTQTRELRRRNAASQQDGYYRRLAGGTDRSNLAVPYQEACGHVLWPAVMTRPDIRFPIGLLVQFTKNPAEIHWNNLKRVIRYLYTTRDLWLHLGGKETIIEGFTDSDWASQNDRHSVSGYVF